MREVLLHFIWQFRHFNHRELMTGAGEPLSILHPGDSNPNQGPDFLRARIRIGDTFRTGDVELHVRSSDWRRHRHEDNPHYSHVILHVVWKDDCIDPPAGIPILVLQDRTPKLLLDRYREWMAHQRFIPCERLIYAGPPIPLLQSEAPPQVGPWYVRLLLERLERRTAFIRACLEENLNDWELTTWWLLARSLGMPANTDAFFAIARGLPLTLLQRHRSETTVMQALLLGQAGLLESPSADPRLKAEYHFYSAKYRLHPSGLPLSFFRMRPAHFPTGRLRQLSGLLSRRSGWFTFLRESPDRHAVLAALTLDPPNTRLGAMIKKSIFLNAFIPVLYAYGRLRREPAATDKALRWLRETPPERNSILTQWQRLGVKAANAAESQALLELKKNFCDPKRCLECAIGQHLLLSDRDPRLYPRRRPSFAIAAKNPSFLTRCGKRRSIPSQTCHATTPAPSSNGIRHSLPYPDGRYT